MKRHGGFWPALRSLLPELTEAAHVTRSSTSAGLYRGDTGQPVPGSDGVHVYVVIADGEDSERFLQNAARPRVARRSRMDGGGPGGRMLERSIVDRSVGLPERLVFEGAPVLVAPLKQDKRARKPTAVSGRRDRRPRRHARP